MGFEIIQDTREQKPIQFDPDECYSSVCVAKLDTGDYSIKGLEEVLCIERKANVVELAGNATQDRFQNEIKRMLEYKYKFIVLEFDLDDLLKYPVGADLPSRIIDKIKIKGNFLLSFINKLQIKGINIIFAGDKDNASKMILDLMKRVWNVEKSRS